MVADETTQGPLDPLAQAWLEAWRTPDRRDLPEWAPDNVVLAGDYANTGPFRFGDSTFLVWPCRLLRNDVTRMVNILKAPRTGGSLVGDLFIQDIVANRPAPLMVNYQTDPDAENTVLTRIEPTFKASPATAALWAAMRKKRDLYQFPHMNGYFQGANLNSLQNKSIKYLWNSEVWIWARGFIQKALNRTEDHRRNCKILNESQAGELGSEWEVLYNNGKRHNYGVRCYNCTRLQPYEFFANLLDSQGVPILEDGKKIRAGIVWDHRLHSNGRTDIAHAQATTRFVCCYCGYEHADEQRSYERFAKSADYVCLDPERSLVDVSLRWNALVMGDWHRLVKRFLQACEVRDAGSTQSLKEFYIGPLALFWDESLSQEKATLTTGGFNMEPVVDDRGQLRKDYVAKPLEWERVRTIGADYQEGSGNDTRHLIVVVRAWSDALVNRSRLLWQGRVNTFAELYALQMALKVPSACVGVDGSFDMTNVAKQCAKYGWTMLIGDDPEHFPHKRKKKKPVRRPYSELFTYNPDKGKKRNGERHAKQKVAVAMRWSNPAIKSLLWNLRHGLGTHKWEVAANVSPDYREGIDSEVKRREFPKGSAVAVWVWKKITPNNHPWDCECMNAVMAVAGGFLTFDIEEDDEDEEEKADIPDASEKEPRKREREDVDAPHDRPEQLTFLGQ